MKSKSYTYNFYYRGHHYPKMFEAISQGEADKQWKAWLERNPNVIPLKMEPPKVFVSQEAPATPSKEEVMKQMMEDMRWEQAFARLEREAQSPELEEDYFEGY